MVISGCADGENDYDDCGDVCEVFDDYDHSFDDYDDCGDVCELKPWPGLEGAR